MNVATHHIVKRQVMEFHLEERRQAIRLQQKVSELCHDSLQRLLDEVCTEVLPPGKQLRLDKLQLDLGHIAWEELDERVPARFEQALREALLKAIHQPNALEDARRPNTTQAEQEENLIRFFLQEGRLPWWAGRKGRSFKAHFQDQWEQSPHHVLAVLRTTLRQEPCLERLLHQLEDPLLTELLQQLQPGIARPLSRVLNQSRQWLKKMGTSQLTSIRKRLIAWQSAFQTALYQGALPLEQLHEHYFAGLLQQLSSSPALGAKLAREEAVALLWQAATQNKQLPLPPSVRSVLRNAARAIVRQQNLSASFRQRLFPNHLVQALELIKEIEQLHAQLPEATKSQEKAGKPNTKGADKEPQESEMAQKSERVTSSPQAQSTDGDAPEVSAQVPVPAAKTDQADKSRTAQERLSAKADLSDSTNHEELTTAPTAPLASADDPLTEERLSAKADKTSERKPEESAPKEAAAPAIEDSQQHDDRSEAKNLLAKADTTTSTPQEAAAAPLVEERLSAKAKANSSPTQEPPAVAGEEDTKANSQQRQQEARQQASDQPETKPAGQSAAKTSKRKVQTDSLAVNANQQRPAKRAQSDAAKPKNAAAETSAGQQPNSPGKLSDTTPTTQHQTQSVGEAHDAPEEAKSKTVDPSAESAPGSTAGPQDRPAAAGPKAPPARTSRLAQERRLYQLPREVPAPWTHVQLDGELVSNAGVVLLWPFLSPFFNSLGLLQDATSPAAHQSPLQAAMSKQKKEFTSVDAAWRAVHLMQYLATGVEETAEEELLLNKLLCGLAPQDPVPTQGELTEAEKEECSVLLHDVIANWTSLRKASPDTLRASYLTREGLLSTAANGYKLTLQRNTFDILLDRLPWSFSLVAMPWMQHMIHVEW